MKFRIYFSSYPSSVPKGKEDIYTRIGYFNKSHAVNYINIKTLDDLMTLIEGIDSPVIVDNNSIEIYNDYRE